MTELQAVIGKVQLEKLNFIIKENKKRYDSIFKHLKNLKLDHRKTPNKTQPIFDTLIFSAKNTKIRKKIVELLNKNGFGTKNLPDAIKWHCAYYWDHAISLKQIKKLKKTKILLENSIAIPIWLRKSNSDYDFLGKKISKILTDVKK